MPSLSFVERMSGILAPLGPFGFRLEISVEDVDRFLAPDGPPAQATGWVTCEALGGNLRVNRGTFTGPPGAQRFDLAFDAADGRRFTFEGHKSFEGGLNTSVLGELSSNGTSVAKGALQQPLPDFVHAITSMRAGGGSFLERQESIQRYRDTFLGTLWKQYQPKTGSLFTATKERRTIPLFTIEGVQRAAVETHYFSTPDKLGLSLLRFLREPSDDVVVLFHGLTTSTDMFIMPEHENLVSYLLDQGHTDIYSVDWRGSMRHSYDLFPGKFTLDDIAQNDIPAAIVKVREIAGPDRRIHVICHCVGSITFMMSLAAGLVPGISSVVSNSVSLTPAVPGWSAIKLQCAPALVSLLNFAYVNPRWGYSQREGAWLGRVIARLNSLAHPECDNPACHMVSFMWGAGRPACFLHENLDPATHDRLGDLFGAVNTNYYIHVREMAKRKRAIKLYPRDTAYSLLPDDYLAAAATISTPVLFVTGAMNRVFPHSNVLTYQELKRLNPSNPHELHVYPGYGHQDVFQGKRCATETFPQMLAFIRRHAG